MDRSGELYPILFRIFGICLSLQSPLQGETVKGVKTFAYLGSMLASISLFDAFSDICNESSLITIRLVALPP